MRPEDVRLYEFDKDEFRDVMREACRMLGGSFSDEMFEESWAEFVELKRRKSLQ